MEQQRIEELIRKGALSEEEKQEITDAADALGISYRLKKGCRKCYEELLLKIYERVEKKYNVSPDGYRLKDASMAFRVAGVLVTNETIKYMHVGVLHESVVARYFVKTEEPKETEENESQL